MDRASSIVSDVVDSGDGTYSKGEDRYIPVDKDNDGIIDSYIPMKDRNKNDTSFKDPKDKITIPVDKYGNIKGIKKEKLLLQ